MGDVALKSGDYYPGGFRGKEDIPPKLNHFLIYWKHSMHLMRTGLQKWGILIHW